jgi:hypothetical protein
MKLRYLLILGILVFLNGFVFTVLLLMVSRELAEPAPTATAVVTTVPTLQPTFTSTPVGPTPTFTVEPTATNTPEPTATNTLVVGMPTATHTVALATPTATSPPATATSTGATATSTTVPPTATPTTPAPTATATTAVSYEYMYTGEMERAPNCDAVYFEGKIIGVGGEAVDGKTVRLRFAGLPPVYRISGADGKPPGEWGFAPLASENFHSPFTFQIDIVESQENPEPNSDTVEIAFTDCSVAGQFTNIVFAYNW